MADFFLSVTGAGDNSGQPFGNAFSYPQFKDWSNNDANAGDNCYMENGTYTSGGNSINSTTRNGDPTGNGYISVIGVTDLSNPVTTEAADADRPLINIGGDIFWTNNYWNKRNFIISGSRATALLKSDVSCRLSNIKVTNAGAGEAINLGGSNPLLYNVEAAAANNAAIVPGGSRVRLIDCHLHDSVTGVSNARNDSAFIGCLFNDISGVGLVHGNGDDRTDVVGNTFYNCGTAITGVGNGVDSNFLRNIIDNCTASATWTAKQLTDLWDWNNFSNTPAPTNVDRGPNTLAFNPQFVDAGGGNFRVQNASLLNLGLNGVAIGAVQTTGAPVGLLGLKAT